MGGIGKTTFARYIYSHPLVVQHFDVLAWVTISQEYGRKNTLQILCQEINSSNNDLNQMSEDKIGEIVYKRLCGRRYLIVMDDIWNIEAWDQVKLFFPNKGDRSRIMITTRLSNLAFKISGSHDFHMQFLDEDKSWDLLCKIVFGKLDCPIELEDIGKEIARNCRGLPLSIAVIGGILGKSNMTQAYWEYSLNHLTSVINLDDNEYCLQLLRISYKELPIHLKQCFLYMGVFPEDYEISVFQLIKLWVSEGILKPKDDKSLEKVAKEYLKELIDRNLILVAKFGLTGKAEFCKVHDLLRDVCLREAQNQKFLCLLKEQNLNIPQDINMERRICIHPGILKMGEYFRKFHHAVESSSLTRSFLYWDEDLLSLRFGLLRVYSSLSKYSCLVETSNAAIFGNANLRYLSLTLGRSVDAISRLRTLFSHLWNVQTLLVEAPFSTRPIMAPSEIWEMPTLRHAILFQFVLPDPLDGEHNFVLENLQELCIQNFKCSEEVAKRIPNIKKLRVVYRSTDIEWEEERPDLCFNDLGRLQKLESLHLYTYNLHKGDKEYMRRNLVRFPHSLKKLVLSGTELNWEDLMIRIGPLPFLQVLKLELDACMGPNWETAEGQFLSLRVLDISRCDLEYWDTDSAHFPRLEHLRLAYLKILEEIPSSIGDIPTLKSIQLIGCSKLVDDSAERIKEEQEENGNDDLQLIIKTTQGIVLKE